MELNLSRRQIRRQIQALSLAIDYQETTIDSWRTGLKMRHGKIESCFSNDPEAKKDIARWRCDIKAFKKLREILKERIMKKEKI